MTAGPLAAQARVEASIDAASVTVGDRVTLTLRVEHDAGAVVEWPDSLDAEPFEVLSSSIAPARTAEGTTFSTATYTLAAFELGSLEVPSVEVRVVAPDGGEEVLETDRFVVEVTSVGVDEEGDIREIRGPLEIPLGALKLLLWIALPLLLAGAIYLLVRRLRRGREEESRPALGPLPRPAHLVALEALDALAASDLLVKGEVKEYHIALSEIVRTYVEGRWRVDALEMTTREVLGGLGGVGVQGEPLGVLGTLLQQCDMVKFAKVRPGSEAAREALAAGRVFVTATAPAPSVDVAAQAGAG